MLDPEVAAALKQNGYISQPEQLSSENAFADFIKLETTRFKDGVITDVERISNGVENYLPSAIQGARAARARTGTSP